MGENLKTYIYIISDGQNYKIGKSNDVEKRLRGLSTGNSKDLSIVCKYEIDSTYVSEVEKQLHNKFKQYNVKNEWFSNAIEKHIPQIKNIIEETVHDTNNKIEKPFVDNNDASSIVKNLKIKMESETMGERVRFCITNALQQGMDKQESKKYILDFFSRIYTSAFNDIFEKHFGARYEDAVKQYELLKSLCIN